ncbi:cyanate permease [Motilibacter peucedani]|uniref:Cyanate permease n=1 Tax=Motilibacter peucedani TaxID=598650 RepID=A0A420XQ93_9ACTN|nr:MFS transporter [Motilibacter peucedani]RKS75417.1 cyanate permease [Motilibacter peucedani]
MTTTTDRPSAARVSSAVMATYAAFIGSGFGFASWASRIPQVRDELDLSPSSLGLVLLAIAAGSIIALPLSGRFVARYGSRLTVTVMAVLLAAGIEVVALGYLSGVVPVVIGLFMLGFGNGAWDVAMNVQGALVERHLGRSIMSRFHAGFSLGTVAGALLGALAIALHVPVTAHLSVVAVVIGVAVPLSVRQFISDHGAHEAEEHERRAVGGVPAWREPRTLLIGLFVLAFAFAEGTGNDWISVAVIDGYDAPAAVGTLAFAVFLTAMTAGRWVGPGMLDRYGRVPVVRALTLLGLVGLLLFVFGPTSAVAFVGAVLWGLGASLGFPVGMSAAADDPARAASRVSAVASIAYCAFLAGPPLIGFLGQHSTVLHGLLAVAALLALAALVAGSVAPLEAATTAQRSEDA